MRTKPTMAGCLLRSTKAKGTEKPYFVEVHGGFLYWTKCKPDGESRSGHTRVVVLSGATLYLTLLKVKAAKGNERRVKGPGQSQFYTIKEEDDTVSVGEYDAGKVKETLLQLGLGVCVMCVMHFKWGYVQPLMIHCLLQPSQVWDCKAVQVHLRGKEAEYPRPWKIGGGSPIEAWAQRKKEEMEAAAKEAKAEEAKKSD